MVAIVKHKMRSTRKVPQEIAEELFLKMYGTV
jgi:hypothetical protein